MEQIWETKSRDQVDSLWGRERIKLDASRWLEDPPTNKSLIFAGATQASPKDTESIPRNEEKDGGSSRLCCLVFELRVGSLLAC